MKPFLTSKPGIISVAVFAVIMTIIVFRALSRHHARASATPLAAAAAVRDVAAREAIRSPAPPAADASTPQPPIPSSQAASLAENAAYLDQYYDLDRRARIESDRQGVSVTRRENAITPSDIGHSTQFEEAVVPAKAQPTRASLRFQGHPPLAPAPHPPSAMPAHPDAPAAKSLPPNQTPPVDPTVDSPVSPARRIRPKRFNAYGRVIKCELVFTIDSTNEQTPFVGLVMEPVYNNGQLVIPAGAELHGTARPDRLRDRIFSGDSWVLVFPREAERPNGRQLTVHGVALDRVEPDVNGMTWGITDGSYGLEGTVIRTMNDEEIKRFAAVFVSAGAQALQERQTDRSGQQSTRNTPQNAVLAGFSADFEKIAADISAEITRHGVFIRVPAGHQFYFYPMQIIDPDAADISSDIAIVK